MMNAWEHPSPVLLKNRGVPVDVAVLDDQGKPTYDDAGEMIVAKAYVQMTNNAIVEIEEKWGSLGGLEDALMEHPGTVVRQTLAFAWDIEPKLAGSLMVPNCLDEYASAITVATSIATGVDPTVAVELLRAAKRYLEGKKQVTAATMDSFKEALEEMTTDSSSVSLSAGSKVEATSTSSGT